MLLKTDVDLPKKGGESTIGKAKIYKYKAPGERHGDRPVYY